MREKNKPRMTLEQFLKELRKTQGRWNDCLRLIRCSMPGSRTSVLFCPITAVCFQKTNRVFWTVDFDKAARAIGLHHETAKRIADAADGLDGCAVIKLKKRLLKACKIGGES